MYQMCNRNQHVPSKALPGGRRTQGRKVLLASSNVMFKISTCGRTQFDGGVLVVEPSQAVDMAMSDRRGRHKYQMG
jgi:hypothetical protein